MPKQLRIYILSFKETEIPKTTYDFLKSLNGFELPGGTWLAPYNGPFANLISEVNLSFEREDKPPFFLAVLMHEDAPIHTQQMPELREWIAQLVTLPRSE